MVVKGSYLSVKILSCWDSWKGTCVCVCVCVTERERESARFVEGQLNRVLFSVYVCVYVCVSLCAGGVQECLSLMLFACPYLLMLAYTRVCVHTHMHAHPFTHLLTDSQSPTHTQVPSFSLTHTHAHKLTRTHTHSRVHTHAHILTHAHAHSLSLTHTHTQEELSEMRRMKNELQAAAADNCQVKLLKSQCMSHFVDSKLSSELTFWECLPGVCVAAAVERDRY